MEYRFLGRSGLQVSAISLGGWLTYGGYAEEGEHIVQDFYMIHDYLIRRSLPICKQYD